MAVMGYAFGGLTLPHPEAPTTGAWTARGQRKLVTSAELNEAWSAYGKLPSPMLVPKPLSPGKFRRGYIHNGRGAGRGSR